MNQIQPKIDSRYWDLIDSVKHDSLKNWQIILTKKSSTSNSDWWHFLTSLNSVLKSDGGMTVGGLPIFASMEQSPEKQERNQHLRAVERAIKMVIQTNKLTASTRIDWQMPGSVWVGVGSLESQVAVWARRKGVIKWDTSGLAALQTSQSKIVEYYEDALD
jgi:hypothetical protein